MTGTGATSDTVIVDWGVGNIGSVANAVRLAGGTAEISASPERIAVARRLILPGVASFDAAVAGIDRLGLREVLGGRVIGEGVPTLGICLGMQLLFDGSDEGGGAGFGWLSGRVRRFSPSPALRLPHMGWNTLEGARACPLLEGLPPRSRFYFVHSFHLDAADGPTVVACCDYGYRFAAVVQSGNLFGVQFHPEKSHQAGLRLIANFLSVASP